MKNKHHNKNMNQPQAHNIQREKATRTIQVVVTQTERDVIMTAVNEAQARSLSGYCRDELVRPFVRRLLRERGAR